MKLDRSINADGAGKYRLILNRRLAEIKDVDGNLPVDVYSALQTLSRHGALDVDGGVGSQCEFFVIRLRDKYAGAALTAYAIAASTDDQEYAAEVQQMANRAGPYSPFCKRPD